MRVLQISAVLAAIAICLAIFSSRKARLICQQPKSGYVKTIFHGAKVWTGEGQNDLSAMAVLDSGRIACIGGQEAVNQLAGTSTSFFNLTGKFVMPGLMDPHIHVLQGGMSLSLPDLSQVSSKINLQQVVKDECARAAEGEWVQGLGWNEATWGGQQPHKSWLDEACANRPVALHRMCGHKIVINSVAERLAELSTESEDPAGGKIYRDSRGLTGVLAESAMDIVKSKLPKPSLADKKKYALRTANYLLSQGITMAHDMGTVPPNEPEAFENLDHVYQELASSGGLPIRLFAFTPLSSWERTKAYVMANGTAHAALHLFWGGLKEFADGSIGASTALFHQPYSHRADEQPSSGVRTIETAQLRQLVEQADKADLQVAVHAIGDLAVDEVLGVYEQVAAKNNYQRLGRRPRHRIEHAQHLAGLQTACRLGKAGIRAVLNPLHLLPDRLVLEERLGTERLQKHRSYAIRSLLQAGVKASIASDFPVVKSEPLLGIFAAVKRRAPGETEPLVEEESVSIEDALRSVTAEAAELAGLEEDLGTLRQGKLADFIVLDADPAKIGETEELPNILQTFVGGQCLYDRNKDACIEHL